MQQLNIHIFRDDILAKKVHIICDIPHLRNFNDVNFTFLFINVRYKSSCYFKIRNTKTGKYSKGGMHPTFTASGKTWTQRTFRSHLTMLGNWIKTYNRRYKNEHNHQPISWSTYYKDCEIVIFEETGTESLKKELFMRSL